MADLPSTFLVGAIATFIPLYLGIFLPTLYKSNQGEVKLRTAYAAGVIFWFFLDVMNDASLLDVNQGFGGDYTHAVLALSFGVALLVLFGLERYVSRASYSASSPLGAVTYGVAGLVALGIGFHAVGEGIDIGAITPMATSVIDAIGGVGPGIAYVLHKLLEGVVIGVVALLAGAVSPKRLAVLGLIAGVPTMLGFFVGLPSLIESTYFFALSGAGAVYAEVKFVPMMASSGRRYAAILAALLGFYSMYLAGLFHG